MGPMQTEAWNEQAQEGSDGDDRIETLADALPKEMARVREVLGHYRDLGPVGMFGAAFIEQDLQAADKASASGDVVAMLRALETLRGITG